MIACRFIILCREGLELLNQTCLLLTRLTLVCLTISQIADIVGADLSVMDRDAARMRDQGPTIFAQVKNNVGVDEIIQKIFDAKAALVA